MKSTLILADAATGNEDGTYSLLRAGISELRVPTGQPLFFTGALVSRLEATPADKGSYEVSIRFQTDGGELIGKPTSLKFEVGDTKQSVLNAVMAFHVQLPKLGRYEFSLFIDGKKIDSTFLDAIPVVDVPHPKVAK